MKKVFGIQRDEQFSPNSVEKDLAILWAVVEPLGGTLISEQSFSGSRMLLEKPEETVIFSMGRLHQTIEKLKQLERSGAKVINPAEGVEACRRSNLVSVMRMLHIPQPPTEGIHGCWIKRGDTAATSKNDVVFCPDEEERDKVRKAFLERGVLDIVEQAHVEGDLVKFYGVLGTGFFRTYYPGDDGQSKFGDEERNGRPRHHAFSAEALQAAAERLSEAVQTPVYGGDAIICEDGSFVLIDFNDWPSFSRCREEAAEAIRMNIKL